jgi:CPA1 family monovalent cation:H+ antiporter
MMSSGAIVALSIVPVVVTTFFVGWVAHRFFDIPLTIALMLGAVLSPTDAVALTGLTRTTRLPQTLINVIQGETLFNDVAGLTLLHLAILALMSGTLTGMDVGFVFAHALVRGFAVGCLGGWLVSFYLKRVKDDLAVNAIIMVVPFALYILADTLDGSGILAIVCAAYFIGLAQHRKGSYAGRNHSVMIWEHWAFVLEATSFLLMGIAVPALLERLSFGDLKVVMALSVVTLGVLVVARFASLLVLWLLSRLGGRKNVRFRGMVLATSFGVRGPVSAMAALAIPYTLGSGTPVLGHDVVVATALVVVILTIAMARAIRPLMMALGIEAKEETHQDEIRLWIQVVDAVLEILDAQREAATVQERFSIDESRDEYAYRRARYREMLEGSPRVSEGGRGAGSQVYMFDSLRSQLMLDLAKAERDTLIGMALHSEFPERMIRKAIRKTDLRISYLDSLLKP